MALPIVETPRYELTLPSTDKVIQYRPFLVKEEKVLSKQARIDEKRRIKEKKELAKQARIDVKKRLKEEKELAKQARLEEKKINKRKKRSSVNENLKTQNTPVKEKVALNTGVASFSISSTDFA